MKSFGVEKIQAGVLGIALAMGMMGSVTRSADAAPILFIEFLGVNIGYDGTNIEDLDPASSDPDPLGAVEFTLDNVLQGQVPSGSSLDLFIPNVHNIDITGDTVFSSPGGTIDLDFTGGDFLSLTLESARIDYFVIPGIVEFTFVGAAAGIDSQSLPFGLEIGAPVSVSFSTQVTSSTDDGANLTSFIANGTGEITGVPEPASLALLGIGAMMIARRGRE